jgi:hypothetical protein
LRVARRREYALAGEKNSLLKKKTKKNAKSKDANIREHHGAYARTRTKGRVNFALENIDEKRIDDDASRTVMDDYLDAGGVLRERRIFFLDS